ncbi:TPA: hypothetical protein SCR28_003687 [Escherichia coli]|nr:hypothetical protein [Escherichia coli]
MYKKLNVFLGIYIISLSANCTELGKVEFVNLNIQEPEVKNNFVWSATSYSSSLISMGAFKCSDLIPNGYTGAGKLVECRVLASSDNYWNFTFSETLPSGVILTKGSYAYFYPHDDKIFGEAGRVKVLPGESYRKKIYSSSAYYENAEIPIHFNLNYVASQLKSGTYTWKLTANLDKTSHYFEIINTVKVTSGASEFGIDLPSLVKVNGRVGELVTVSVPFTGKNINSITVRPAQNSDYAISSPETFSAESGKQIAKGNIVLSIKSNKPGTVTIPVNVTIQSI